MIYLSLFQLLLVLGFIAVGAWLWTGSGVWNEKVRSYAWRIWLAGFWLALLTTALVWGTTFLLSGWPFWIGALLVAVGLFALRDFRHRVGWFRPRPTAPSLDSRLSPHAGQAPPPWMAQAVQRGVEGWTMEDGKLTRRPSAAGRVKDWLSKPL